MVSASLEDHMDNVLISIPEAGKMLSVGRSTLYRLIGDGQLETVKIGRRTLIRVTSIRALAGEASEA
jgi:excisionase family DNA binding protein